MRIAIPIFNARVSPRFDCAPEFQLVDLEQGCNILKRNISCADWALSERVARLSRLSVDVLICGGIERIATDALQCKGIKVFSWVSASAEDALSALIRGELETGMVLTQGGRCCGRWRNQDRH